MIGALSMALISAAFYFDNELVCTIEPEAEALGEHYQVALEHYESKECQDYRALLEAERIHNANKKTNGD